MKVNFRHFPHPVLAPFNNDYISGDFQANIEINFSGVEYNIEVEFELKCIDIEKLILSKKAKFGIHVECPLTCFRKLVSSSESNISTTFGAEKLDGKVEISTFVFADKKITGYSSKLFKSFFEEYPFSFTAGDILAVGDQFSFEAEKDLDPIGVTPSIFTVQPNHDTDVPLNYSLSEKINIFLAEENFDKYNYLRDNQGLHQVFACILAVPVLTAILQDIKENKNMMEANYSSRRWYRVLIKRLKELNINLEKGDEIQENIISLALKIIGNPLKHSFADLEELIYP